MSVPLWRDILTIILSPKLASQAPMVRIAKVRDGMDEWTFTKLRGRRTTILKIIPSRHKSDIRKWEWFTRNAEIMYIYIIRGVIKIACLIKN